MESVVVGMSGGIDSFVTALLLRQRGYEVIGVSLELWEKNDHSGVRNICCDLGIPWVERNTGELFRQKVVRSFVRDYLTGYTPSPCCLCNSYVKWEALHQVAEELKVPYLATGHYVRIKQQQGKYYIQQGVDARKDQSYFLWGVSQEILSKAITPLGDFTKEEVKAWASSHGYEELVRRKESMGVCFLRGMDYREFLRQYSGVGPQPGPILDRTGQIVGEHSGVLNYTVGQKRGMPCLQGEPSYVAEIIPEHNVIVADRKAGLYTDELWVEKAVFVDERDLAADDVTVKIRGLGLNPQGRVKIRKMEAGRLKIELSDPAWAVAPGQPVAFFRGDCVIGGGKASKIK